jgi:hypothetical protein
MVTISQEPIEDGGGARHVPDQFIQFSEGGCEVIRVDRVSWRRMTTSNKNSTESFGKLLSPMSSGQACGNSLGHFLLHRALRRARTSAEPKPSAVAVRQDVSVLFSIEIVVWAAHCWHARHARLLASRIRHCEIADEFSR